MMKKSKKKTLSGFRVDTPPVTDVIGCLKSVREKYPLVSIGTEVSYRSDVSVEVRAVIKDGDLLLGSAHASEPLIDEDPLFLRSKNNRGVALETAETRAVGRALMFAGFDADGHIELASQLERSERELLVRQLRELYRSDTVNHRDLLRIVNAITGGSVGLENLGEVINKLPVGLLQKIVEKLGGDTDEIDRV